MSKSSRIPNDARRLIVARGLRGFADGAVSVLLASYLTRLGFSPFEVGAIVTATLFGSALVTLAVGFAGSRWRRRDLLRAASALMLATGLGFLELETFWPLFLVAAVGTLNPTGGDVSIFLPVEQAALAHVVPAAELTRTFGWYNVSGAIAGALGALASAIPATLADRAGIDAAAAERLGFVVYAAIAVVEAFLYRGLSCAIEHGDERPAKPLTTSWPIVARLTVLFSLDSFGGGFVVQSLLVLWLYQRFALSPAVAGVVFFAAGVLASLSQLLSPLLASRIGRIRTMVYTHLPANLFLVFAGVAPTAELAVAFLLARMALSQMDVPARQSYVMAIVRPEERAAASSMTNVPRSMATAVAPLLAGWLLDHSSFGWPLVIGGSLKALYDVLLLVQFRSVRPEGEI